jgi:hypothetical protein
MKYNGPERRQYVQLSQEDFERLTSASAERAKELALRDIYIAVGKSVVSKIMWVLGASSAAVAAWLHFKP